MGAHSESLEGSLGVEWGVMMLSTSSLEPYHCSSFPWGRHCCWAHDGWKEGRGLDFAMGFIW